MPEAAKWQKKKVVNLKHFTSGILPNKKKQKKTVVFSCGGQCLLIIGQTAFDLFSF